IRPSNRRRKRCTPSRKPRSRNGGRSSKPRGSRRSEVFAWLSLALQSGSARNGGPTGGFAANVIGKLIRPAVERFKALLGQRFQGVRRVDRLLRGSGECVDHRPWRAGGRQEGA